MTPGPFKIIWGIKTFSIPCAILPWRLTDLKASGMIKGGVANVHLRHNLFFLCQCVEKSVTEIYVQFKLRMVCFCTLAQGTPRLLVPMAQSLDLLHAARLHTDFEI